MKVTTYYKKIKNPLRYLTLISINDFMIKESSNGQQPPIPNDIFYGGML